MKPARTKIERQLKFESPRIGSIVTEKIERNQYVIKNKNGATITLNWTASRELRKFLEQSGCIINQQTTEGRRRRKELDGVSVSILPLQHDQNYSKGAFVRIKEPDALSYAATNKVRQYLVNKGIDMTRECTLITENKNEASCDIVFKRRRGNP
jgi:hypothetical protein